MNQTMLAPDLNPPPGPIPPIEANRPETPVPARQRMFRLTLGTKFILLIATVLSLGLATGAMVNYQHQRSLLLQGLKEKAAIQGQLVSSISKEPILSHDYVSLNSYMQDISRTEDIVYGVIVSTKGEHLTSYLDTEDPHVKRALAESKSSDSKTLLSAINRAPGITTETFPVRFDEERIADLVIGLDQTRVTNLARAELIKQLLFNAAIIIGLGVAIYFIFRFSALRPIRGLMAGAARVSTGNLSEPVLIHSHDELGELTHSFNQMVARLKGSLADSRQAMEQMRELNRTLEARVQERTARLELAQRIAQMGHWDFEIGENTFHASHQVYALLGISPDKPLRRTMLLRTIHPEDRRDLFQAVTQAIAKARPFEEEFRIFLPTGEERILIITAELTLNEENGRSRLFGILQDITDRAKAEHTAQKALKDKLNAESANEAKTAFLANMSHEIRTPLTAIIGFAEMMLESEHGKKERDDATRTIIENSRHLLRVINEILDLSKIESRHLEIEILPTNVLNVVADVESLMGMAARDKCLSFAVEYDFPVPRQIHTDPTRLKQILLNLCSNAIKFTEKGGVRLRIGFQRDKQLLNIAVMDTGIGIGEAKIGRLFAPFTQADSSTTRRFGGTGLGLYISKHLAEMLGGTVAIKSIEGLGTRFDVTIATGEVRLDELVNAHEERHADAGSEQGRARIQPLGGRVLLADDSSDNQRLVSLYVNKTGAEIELAGNGKIAFEHALAGDFDLVLMDMQMPIMDGIETTHLLRQTGYSGPIVMLTANAFKEDRERCANAGCNDFLTKPIDQAAFYQVLNKYLPARIATAPEASSIHDAPLASTLDDEIYGLAEEFIDDMPNRLANIRAAHESGNLRDLKMLMHQLKGIGSSFGYPAVTHQAAKIELQIKRNDLNDLQPCLGQFYEVCEQAINHFAQHRRKAA